MNDKLIEAVRNGDYVTRLNSINKGAIIEGDYYRVVAAVEEANAEFEGFCLRDYPGRPDTLLGFPVFYSDAVQEGEVFGGMWSDADDNGNLRHHAAFAYLTCNW